MSGTKQRKINFNRVKHKMESRGIQFKEMLFIIINPYFQVSINTIFLILTSIYFADFGANLTWSPKGTVLFVLYALFSLLFTYINNDKSKTAISYNSLKKLSTAIESLIYLRTNKLCNFNASLDKKIVNNKIYDQSDLEIITDTQPFVGLICKEVYNNIECKYSYSKAQVVLFQQFKDPTDRYYISPVAFGTEGDIPPNCMGRKLYIDSDYSDYVIVKMFMEPKSSYKIISDPENVKENFKYIPEDACTNEDIKQYLAIPIRNRDGILTAVLQISFYHIILPDDEDDIKQYVMKCIEPFLRFIDLVFEEQHVIETYNRCIIGLKDGSKSENKGDE